MRCPECGSTGPFLVESKVTVRVRAESTGEGIRSAATTSPQWDGESYAMCENCEVSQPFNHFLENGRKIRGAAISAIQNFLKDTEEQGYVDTGEAIDLLKGIHSLLKVENR